MDSMERRKVYLFSDSCAGQNRNSVLPTMCLWFLSSANYVEQITLHYFEPHHGQNEGDSVHSCVERAVKRLSELYLPSQLATVIEMSRKERNEDEYLKTSDILDFKKQGSDLGILRQRSATDGHRIDWTQVKQLMVTKDKPLAIGFKLSHKAEHFSWLHLDDRRQQINLSPPSRAYHRAPKLSDGKYKDLMELLSGDTPVISCDEHTSFYKSLPH